MMGPGLHFMVWTLLSDTISRNVIPAKDSITIRVSCDENDALTVRRDLKTTDGRYVVRRQTYRSERSRQAAQENYDRRRYMAQRHAKLG